MRAESKGFVIHIEGTWMEISNKYGVLEHGDIILPDEVPEDFAEKKLEAFIEKHSVLDFPRPEVIKRVAFDEQSKEYIQLQAVQNENDGYWTVQKYDNELVYMGEIWSGCQYKDEAKDWMHSNFDVESCLTAEVYKNPLGDCTNGGISAERRELYILSATKGPFEPEDIRQCVYIEWREVMGETYINCKPAYCRKRWYMAGGNFLYTSDSRFREITKSKYPISIHDRYEGR